MCPAVPSASESTSVAKVGTAPNVNPVVRGDSGVVRALEALLAAAQARVLAREMTDNIIKSNGEDRRVGGVVPVGAKMQTAAGSGDGGVDNDGCRDDDVLSGFAAGVCSGDEAIDRVTTVLRMLFLLDLRGLQDDVNAVLAMAQSTRTRLNLK